MEATMNKWAWPHTTSGMTSFETSEFFFKINSLYKRPKWKNGDVSYWDGTVALIHQLAFYNISKQLSDNEDYQQMLVNYCNNEIHKTGITDDGVILNIYAIMASGSEYTSGQNSDMNYGMLTTGIAKILKIDIEELLVDHRKETPRVFIIVTGDDNVICGEEEDIDKINVQEIYASFGMIARGINESYLDDMDMLSHYYNRDLYNDRYIYYHYQSYYIKYNKANVIWDETDPNTDNKKRQMDVLNKFIGYTFLYPANIEYRLMFLSLTDKYGIYDGFTVTTGYGEQEQKFAVPTIEGVFENIIRPMYTKRNKDVRIDNNYIPIKEVVLNRQYEKYYKRTSPKYIQGETLPRRDLIEWYDSIENPQKTELITREAIVNLEEMLEELEI